VAGLDPATHRSWLAIWNDRRDRLFCTRTNSIREETVGGLIYLIGLIVVILFILSFLGLR